jgi:hypothetical protein
MTQAPTAKSALQRIASGTRRLYRAYRVLPYERRLAAFAAIGLFVAMFLPWYQQQFFAVIRGKPVPASDTLTAWGAFSFVEAAVLLVAGGVLTLLFHRAEGRAFHLPGGDGGVITAAGAWTCVLVVWRIFDKQGGQASGQNVVTNGIEWGIFVTLGVAVFLTYAGSRIRAAHRPEPALPGDLGASAGGVERRRAPEAGGVVTGGAERRRAPESGGGGRRVRRPRAGVEEDPETVRMPPRARADEDPEIVRMRRKADEDPETVRIDDPPTVPIPEHDAATIKLRRGSDDAPTNVSRRSKPTPDDDQLTIPLDD